jgi:hypothetical protein
MIVLEAKHGDMEPVTVLVNQGALHIHRLSYHALHETNSASAHISEARDAGARGVRHEWGYVARDMRRGGRRVGPVQKGRTPRGYHYCFYFWCLIFFSPIITLNRQIMMCFIWLNCILLWYVYYYIICTDYFKWIWLFIFFLSKYLYYFYFEI